MLSVDKIDPVVLKYRHDEESCYWIYIQWVLQVYNGYRLSFMGFQQPGCVTDHQPPSSVCMVYG